MKKFWKVLLPCLLCGALLAVCTGCSGYESESIAYTGEEGSMVFLGVNFNGTNSRSDGVKIQVNFAHEAVSAEEVPYSIYAGTDGNFTSVYTLPLSFSTDGTFSARVSQDQFLVTPKGLDRMNLRNDELVLIQDNYREMGKIPSRAAGFFKAIYDTHPWVNAIIVSKPVNVMGYAVTEEKIDTKTIPESYILLRDIVDIPCAEHYKDPMATVKKIAPNAPVIMLRNDCLLTVGSTLLQAFDRLEVAEFCANSLLASKRLGGVKPINEEQKKDLIKAFHLPE